MSDNAWHRHCVLRDDVREGKLELAEFAADLWSVRIGDAPDVYQNPHYFFDRTYPTHDLKILTRDVLQRLTGHGGNPVITLQVAYGGGKTHSLINLLHLAERGAELQTHGTVQEFMQFSGLEALPQARVGILPFDKFDVKNGLSVVGPTGEEKRVKTPWGALAYQLGGEEGIAIVAEHEADYTNPAESTLVELLRLPQKEDASTLILLDEALMYTRTAVNDDPKRLGTFQDFFQALTQAVKKVSTAAIVASLITSEIVAGEPTGLRVLKMLEGVFRRVEEAVEPVSEGDVAELLRRRLFESVAPETERGAIVEGIIESREKLKLSKEHTDQDAYDKLIASYPFHPDLIDVFYQKWTQLDEEKFQRTRGVFRTFALLLRDAFGKDPSALVGPNAFLHTDAELSNALKELVQACEEGNQWIPILTGELEKACSVQEDFPLLTSHEIETAVVSTFLHSQPAGQKAEDVHLHLLLAHADVDPISVEKGLAKWRESSWFLKEDGRSWALGTAPNLTRIHDRAMRRVNAEQVTENLEKRIRDARLGQNSDKVDVHTFPQASTDISDTPELRLVLAGPEHATVPGEAVEPELKTFFQRTYPNSIVMLAPSRPQLAGLRQRIRRILGWESVENGTDRDLLSDFQQQRLLEGKREDEKDMRSSVISTYSVLIAVDEEGEVKASQLPPGLDSPFERIKTALLHEDRLLTTSLDPDLLTPDSYYEIWGETERSKPVQDLYRMFASLPRLPRLLSRQVYLDTVRRGVTEGRIVLLMVRPDGSQYTYWRELPTNLEDIWNMEMEVVPMERADLHNVDPELLAPGRLPTLWTDEHLTVTVADIRAFFDGVAAPKLASDEVLFAVIREAIRVGVLMTRTQDSAYLREKVPDSEMTDALELLRPLPAISAAELSPENLPEAWADKTSSVGKLRHALAVRKGTPIPWTLILDAVSEARDRRVFEFVEGSPQWPCDPADADKVGLRVRESIVKIEPKDLVGPDVKIAWTSGTSTLGLIKETLESKIGAKIPDDIFLEAAKGAMDIYITSNQPITDNFYNIWVRQPQWMRHTESQLTEMEIQDLGTAVAELCNIAPELDFLFRISITAEGDPSSDETLKQINEVLQKVTEKLKFD